MPVLPFVLAASLAQAPARAPNMLTEVPPKPDPAGRYTFYLHGRIIEVEGRNAVSPDFGRYEYDAILTALTASGRTVVSEVRTGDAGQEFVDRTADQIRRLRAAGVPARNIAVVGASKGGLLTLRIAAGLGEREISYVILAGCGKPTADLAPKLRGRILSIYDKDDRFKPSCQATFAKADLTASREIVLGLGLDHGLLYSARPEWVDPATQWIAEGAAAATRP